MMQQFFILMIVFLGLTVHADPKEEDYQPFTGHPRLQPLQEKVTQLVHEMNEWARCANQIPEPMKRTAADLGLDQLASMLVVLENRGGIPVHAREKINKLKAVTQRIAALSDALEKEMRQAAGMRSIYWRTVDAKFHQQQEQFYAQRLAWVQQVSQQGVPIAEEVVQLLKKSCLYWEGRYERLVADQENFKPAYRCLHRVAKKIGLPCFALVTDDKGTLISVSPDQARFYRKLSQYLVCAHTVMGVADLFYGLANFETYKTQIKFAENVTKHFQPFVLNDDEQDGENTINERSYAVLQHVLAARSLDEVRNVFHRKVTVDPKMPVLHEEGILRGHYLLKIRDWKAYNEQRTRLAHRLYVSA